ncbi:MAG: hypothetical protein K8R36_24775 [Planctomycetales bacterium]|nr:hypothetical protein [Planctomycetales bacterium]
MSTRFLALLSVVILCSVAAGQDEKPKVEAKAAAQEAKAASAAEIEKLMEQLDSNVFAERQAAQQKLTEIGKAALPAIEKGTQNVSREVAVRSLDILKGQFQKGDDATKAAAKEVLERLAKNSDGTLAKRAGEILSPPKSVTQNPQGVPGIVPGRIGGAQIQIQIAGGAGGNFKRSVKDVNGVKEIEAEENGKKVKIVDDPAKGIKLEMTETKDGKETTQKFEAKDAAELKTKHPEAHKLYEEYSKQPAGIQIRGFAVPGAIPPGAIPAIPVLPGGVRRIKIMRPDDLDALKNSADGALKDLDSAIKSLKDAKAGSEELKKAQEQVESAKKQVEELKAKLGE